MLKRLVIVGWDVDVGCWPITSLLVRLLARLGNGAFSEYRNAKGPANTGVVVCRGWVDPLRRHGADSAFLQASETASPSAAVAQGMGEPWRLSGSRLDSGACVRGHRRVASDQQDRDSAIQRSLSVAAGDAAFSRSVHAASVSEAPSARCHSPCGANARSVAPRSVGYAASPQQSGLRFGLGGAHALRQATGSADRLQSQKARSPFLSSAVVFRGATPRVLACHLASGRCGYQHGRHSLYAPLYGQGSDFHCALSHPGSRRRRFLRTPLRRIPRSDRLRLCHRGPRVQDHSLARLQRSVSSFAFRLGCRGVPIPSYALESSPSLCCRASSAAGGSCRGQANDPVQRSALRLLALGDQFADECVAGVALLLPACDHREEHSGTVVRSASGKDPHRRLDGERGLLSYRVVRLQPGALVQTLVPATGVSSQHGRNRADRLLDVTGTSDLCQPSKRFAVAEGLSLSRRLRCGIQEGKPFATCLKKVIL